MRRFVFAVLSAAALIIFLSPDTPKSPPTTEVPALAAQMDADTETDADAAAFEPSSTHVRSVPPVRAPAPAPAQSKPEAAPVTLAEQVRGRGNRRDEGYEAIAPAHIPASAKAGGLDVTRADLRIADDDLAIAAQRELSRLACYDAGIDGVWGRQSRAAVESFAERASGAWEPEPSRRLIRALRSAPDGFCSKRCEEGPGIGQCALTVAVKDAQAVHPDRDDSYLPPWMRGEEFVNVEPEAVTPGARPVLSDAVRAQPRARPRAERRRPVERRTTERAAPRRPSSDWRPDGWPGTSR